MKNSFSTRSIGTAGRACRALGGGLFLFGFCFAQPAPTPASAPAETYLKFDLYDPALTVVDADPEQKAEGRTTGQVPEGWKDDTSWAKVQVHYQQNEDDGQKYLSIQTNVSSGYAILDHPIADYGDHSLFKLVIKARSVDRVPVEFGLRRITTPWTYLWSEKVPVNASWQTYQYLFELDKNPQPAGFYIDMHGTGTVDIASITLERISKDKLLADFKARYPDGGPRNLLRTTRLPLGLQSGWAIMVPAPPSYDQGPQDFDPLLEADSQVVGLSGAPTLHVHTTGSVIVYGEPFDVLMPVQKHVASFYVKGTGTGVFGMMQNGNGSQIATVPFTAGPDWKRVEVPFSPRIGSKFYNLRFTVSGDIWMDGFQAGPAGPDGKATPYETQYPAEISLACVAKETVASKVQFSDEPARVEYAVTTTAAPETTGKFKLRARAINLYGETSEVAPVALEAKKMNQGTFDFPVSPQHPFGPSRIETWVEDETGKQVSPYQEIIIHRLQRPRYWGRDAPDSPFGSIINGDSMHIQMAKAAGLNWARLWDDGGVQFIGWYFLERQQGKWTFYDTEIKRYRDEHIKLMGNLVTAPEWASYFQAKHRPYFDTFFQPKDLSQYANYAKTVAQHYKGTIDAWDVWNEPWNAAWFATSYDSTKLDRAAYRPSAHPAQDYVALEKAATDAVKSVDPTMRVIGINTTTTEVMNKPYPDIDGKDWTAMLKPLNADQYCDALGYHQYDPAFNGSPTDSVHTGFQVAVGPFLKDNPQKPVWYTEGSAIMGYIASGFYHYTLPYPDGEDVLDTGNRMCRQAISLLSVGDRHCFFYSMACYRYFGADQRPWRYLVTEEGALHPSAVTFSAMAWRLEDTTFQKIVTLDGQNQVFIFSGKGRTVAVVEPAQANHSLELPSVAGWTLSDMLGNPMTDRKMTGNHLAYIETAETVDQLEPQLQQILVTK